MNSHRKTESTNPVRYVPLDVSKRRLDYGLTPERTAAVTNTREGIATLIEQLAGHSDVHVVCEATGGYERAVSGTGRRSDPGEPGASGTRPRVCARRKATCKNGQD